MHYGVAIWANWLQIVNWINVSFLTNATKRSWMMNVNKSLHT
jgi:hypothetical protein